MVSITLVNKQNVSVNKTVDFSSIQRAESKYDLRIQFLGIGVMIHEVWPNAQSSYLGKVTWVELRKQKVRDDD